MELCSTFLSGLPELFLQDALEKAAEKSHGVLHDAGLRKVVLMNKRQKIPAKLQFSHLARRRQSAKCSDSSHPGLHQGRLLPLLALKTSSSSSKHKKGKNIFGGSSPPLQAQVGGILE